MDKSALTVNAAIPYIADWGVFLTRMKALNPAMIMAYIDNYNDKARIDQIAWELPEAEIIGRMVVDGVDGNFHGLRPEPWPPGKKFLAEGEDILNVWGDLGRGKNRSLYVLNEPDLKDISTKTLANLKEWLTSLAKQAAARKTHITVINAFTGQPPVVKGMNGDEWDSRFDFILQIAAEYKEYVTIGLHEYFPDAEGHRVGRINCAIRRAEVLFTTNVISRLPNFNITEFGADHNSALDGPYVNNYRSRGWSGTLYAEKSIIAYNDQLAPVVRRGLLKGVAFFPYGSLINSRWRNFDTERDVEFWNYLLDNRSRFLVPNEIVEQPIPTIPAPKPTEPGDTPHWLDVLNAKERAWLIQFTKTMVRLPLVTGTVVEGMKQ